ncbi:hypothetical protein GW933_04405 [Candidatus Falkowbacteria bacterium]|uniref:Uncharacterized protein n=1 Tax=Candidatus Buchananbacteria bacterium CG10_big_fil_rev_8_21_14_0_10_33_19 TaxID=1974525 RepID=A0A2H0W504_9BACT|nr:hypothetical protein [Candidatus Falkowbacteria bacterium]PIS06426.1 MAG: hypothetical protein COT80_00585 [Candidatus Buchananbacteria bacterium CG10_big_fil_rev_8_21_14_0_10_33_19]
MGVQKNSTPNTMPGKMPSKVSAVKKKTILQQVMKPKDWAAIGFLVVVSAFCWIWVLNAYQETIGIDDFVSGKISTRAIDKTGLL